MTLIIPQDVVSLYKVSPGVPKLTDPGLTGVLQIEEKPKEKCRGLSVKTPVPSYTVVENKGPSSLEGLLTDRELAEDLEKILDISISKAIDFNGRTNAWLAYLEQAYFEQGQIFTTRQRLVALKLALTFYSDEILDLKLPELKLEEKAIRNEVRMFLYSVRDHEENWITLSHLTASEERLIINSMDIVDDLSPKQINEMYKLMDLMERRKKVDQIIDFLNKDIENNLSEKHLDQLMWALEESIDINWFDCIQIYYENVDELDSDENARELFLSLVDRFQDEFGDKFVNKLIDRLNKKNYIYGEHNQSFCLKLLERISRKSPEALDYIFDQVSSSKGNQWLSNYCTIEGARNALGFKEGIELRS